MNRSDAWERFAQCRRLQPDALQVLVSADIVDALLTGWPREGCERLGGVCDCGVRPCFVESEEAA